MNENKTNKIGPAIFTICLIVLILFPIALSNKVDYTDYTEVTYNEFTELVNEGLIDTVYYEPATEYMYFTMLNDTTKALTREERDKYDYQKEDYRKCLYPGHEGFRENLLKNSINVRLMDKEVAITTILPLLSTVLTVIMVVYFIVLISKLSKKGFNGVLGNNDKPIEITSKSDKTFADVIGHDEILDDIKFMTGVLKNPNIVRDWGSRVPKGILFTGEPGTGKTLIAKAMAGEAGVPFIYMNASSFIEMYVGVGAKRVRELFKAANENAPCIVFIDEIDAVGKSRERSASGSSEDLQTINALLQEMDGFKPNKGVLVIAATNNPKALDKALTRAGRFDREIIIAPPKNYQTRQKLFEHYTKNMPLGEDVDLVSLAKQTTGFTGADIEAVCNEAGLVAAYKDEIYVMIRNTFGRAPIYDENDVRTKETGVLMRDFEEAIDKRLLKGNKSRNAELKERVLVAYHEAGHAVAAYLLGQPIARATIVGTTSGVGGFVLHEDSENRFETKIDVQNDIKVYYGGRASEEIKFGEENVSVGASSDIQAATSKLRAYVMCYGFDDNGVLDITQFQKEDFLYDRMVELSKSLYKETVKLLKDNYDKVAKLAEALLIEETISGDDITKLLKE